MELFPVSPQTTVADLLAQYPQAAPVFVQHRMSCVGCSMSGFESLTDAAKIYQVDLKQLLTELGQAVQAPAPASDLSPAIKESIMSESYTFFPELSGTIDSIPQESIVSRTIYRDDHLKAIMFAFAPGQELSEHTASVPAIIQIVEGEADLTVGEDHYDVKPGAWVRMPAQMKHSILAHTPVKMLLIMLP